MKFTKMHGLGNDFVIIYFDKKENLNILTNNLIKKISHRNYGVGCDQLIALYKETNNHYNMVIFNQDGSKANACGNATRCVASYLKKHFNEENAVIKVKDRSLETKIEDDLVSVNMGFVSLLLKDRKMHNIDANYNTKNLESSLTTQNLKIKNLDYIPYIVNIANDHAVFVIDNENTQDYAKKFGKEVETHQKFPNKINVSFVYIKDRKNIKITTWERGAGLTLACGSAACASFAICRLLNKVENNCTMQLKAGVLQMSLLNNSVIMKGPSKEVFEGSFSQSFLKNT